MMMGKKFPVISVTSGKGGVGKTLTTVNLAIAAAQLGKRVLILDGDFGLANVDVVLGLSSRYNINDVLDGFISLNEIILAGPMGIHIIPSGSGIAKLTNLSRFKRQRLFDEISTLQLDFDLMIVDTGAGIADIVLHLNACADHVVVVTTPEPHAITDAYAMIKVMTEQQHDKKIQLLVNMARSEIEAKQVFFRLQKVSEQFLKRSIEFLGFVPMDPLVQKLVIMRQAASPKAIHTPAGQAWNRIGQNLLESSDSQKLRDQDSFWTQMIWTDPVVNGMQRV